MSWRVRAVRNLYGKIPTGLPAVSYGPWSPTYTTDEPRDRRRRRRPAVAAADTTREQRQDAGAARADARLRVRGTRAARRHVRRPLPRLRLQRLGLRQRHPPRLDRRLAGLRPADDRVAEAAADDHGRDQGSPSVSQGPQEGRIGAAAVHVRLGEGLEHRERPRAGEAGGDARTAGAGARRPATPGRGRPSNTPPENDPSLPATPKSTGAPVDLWDSGWPNGRFYWTVVPVRFESADPKQTALAPRPRPARALPRGRRHRLRGDAARPDRHRRDAGDPHHRLGRSTPNQVSTTTARPTRTASARSCRTSPRPSTTGISSCRRTSARPAACRRSARAACRSSPARPRPSSRASPPRAG